MTTTLIRERPIIMQPESVRTILEGRKKMTRRVVKPQPILVDGRTWEWPYASVCHPRKMSKASWADGIREVSEVMGRFSPYGLPMDHLWLRHRWWHRPGPSANPGNEQAWDEYTKSVRWPGGLRVTDCQPTIEPPWRCMSPIRMPRWASTLTLQIMGVRVERLQEMTAEDARTEGVQIPISTEGGDLTPLVRVSGEFPPSDYLPGGSLDLEGRGDQTLDQLLRAHFAAGWDSLNQSRGFSWASNPWVHVIAFRLLRETRAGVQWQ